MVKCLRQANNLIFSLYNLNSVSCNITILQITYTKYTGMYKSVPTFIHPGQFIAFSSELCECHCAEKAALRSQ